MGENVNLAVNLFALFINSVTKIQLENSKQDVCLFLVKNIFNTGEYFSVRQERKKKMFLIVFFSSTEKCYLLCFIRVKN